MADSSVTIPAICSSHSGTVPLDLYNHIFAKIPLQSFSKISKRAFFCPRVTELLRCVPLIASNNLGKVIEFPYSSPQSHTYPVVLP